jgi:hypothetical protein
MLALLSILVACAEPAAPQPQAPDQQALPLRSLPPKASARCTRLFGSLTLCPTSVPETEGPYRTQVIRAPGSPFATLDLASNAPYPRFTRRNRPPRFAHVVVDHSDVPPHREYGLREVAEVPPDLPKHRGEGLLLGRPSWSGRAGVLVLAPAYPAGGIHGDHLLFTWREGGRYLTISLHVWPPLGESEATLRVLVASIEEP